MTKTTRGFKMDVASNEPNEVKNIFDWYESNFQFIPNLAKVMSSSPAALMAYWLSQNALSEHGILTPEEHNVIQMAIGVENRCKYCVSGHQMAGAAFFGSKEEDLMAVRNEQKIENEKFEALRSFAIEVYRKKGRVSDKTIEDFESAGYSKAQAIEVITNIAVKIMSNLTNQLTGNELDDPLTPFAKGLFEQENENVLK